MLQNPKSVRVNVGKYVIERLPLGAEKLWAFHYWNTEDCNLLIYYILKEYLRGRILEAQKTA